MRGKVRPGQVALQTFGGKVVRVVAPLPPRFLAAFEKLGWTGLAERSERARERAVSWTRDEDADLTRFDAEDEDVALTGSREVMFTG